MKRSRVDQVRESLRLPSLQEATVSWLDQYQKGRLEVHLDTSDLGEQMKTLRVMARQVIVGLVLVGMIIGSAIAASVSPMIEGVWNWTEWLPNLALLGYVFAMAVAALLVIALIWRILRGDRD